MSFQALAIPAVILAAITAIVLLISTDWRFSVAALAVQYISVFLLASLSWPVEMAVVKLVAGWMSGAVLGMALVGAAPSGAAGSERGLATGGLATKLFRVLVAVLASLVAASQAPNLIQWVPEVGLEQAYGAMFLVGLGLLHLGLSAQPLRVILGLLTVLGGFEILYAAVESSTLVAGLLAGVDLGLALVGAFLLTASAAEETV